MCKIWYIFYPYSRFPAQRCDLEPIYERLLMDFIVAYKGSRRLQKDGDETQVPKDTIFDTVCTTTQRHITTCQSCKTGHISMVMSLRLLSDPAAKIDQDESSRVLRFYIVCWSLKPRSVQQLNWAIKNWMIWEKEHGFAENEFWQPEKCNSFGTSCQVLLPFKSRRIFRNT